MTLLYVVCAGERNGDEAIASNASNALGIFDDFLGPTTITKAVVQKNAGRC